jgi:hypothetical protein
MAPNKHKRWFGHYKNMHCQIDGCRKENGGPICPPCWWGKQQSTFEQRDLVKHQFNKQVMDGKYDQGVSRFCVITRCWEPVPKNLEFDEDGRCQKCYDKRVTPPVPLAMPAIPPSPPPAPAIPPLPSPTTVAANNRDREHKQCARYGHDGNRQGRGRRDGEICGRDADRGQAGNNRTGGGAEVAEDPGADSINRDNRSGPARRRSRSSRRAQTAKLTKLATKVHQELGDVTGLVNFLRAEILE